MAFLYSVAQVQSYEKNLLNKKITTLDGLLNLALHAIWRHLHPQILLTDRCLILCGKGYNGADGLMLALHMHRHGYSVSVCMVDSTQLKSHTQKLFQLVIDNGIEVISDPNFSSFDMYIDAMLGIGFNGRQLKPRVKYFIESLNAAQGFCVSIDCPSGMNADSGLVCEDAVRADMTIMLLLHKKGMYCSDAYDYTGSLVFDDCSLDYPELIPCDRSIELYDPSCRLLDASMYRCNVHKGDYGRVLIIGGNDGMHGAALLAATAAARSGCGHVSLLVKNPDHSYIPYDFTTVTVDALSALLSQSCIQTIVIGPGLGNDEWAVDCLRQCLSYVIPTVIDADALRLLVDHSIALHSEVVLTPHHGEAAALLGCSTTEVSADRYQACFDLQSRYAAMVLLKGPGSIIADKSGMRIVNGSCASLAVAGSGDVLAGLIAGLVVQRAKLDSSLIVLAVLVHLQIGKLLQDCHGGRGMMASDMFPYIPKIINELSGSVYDDRNLR